MKKTQSKHRVAGDEKLQSGKNDIFYYMASVAAVVLLLIFVPKLLAALGVSFLSASAGLNKLFSVVLAAGLGWLCLLPSQGYKDFIELSKGAKTEWRKTVKPEREMVMRTTMMVLMLVFVFAVLILILDGVFGAILRMLVN